MRIPGVKHTIVVSSAKGGVGKSTTAVNLAVGLSKLGLRTSILDADIFGPSIPKMMNLSGEAEFHDKLKCLINYGIKTMSMGYLVDDNQPVVWRGMMVQKAIQQLLWDVDYSNTDILVVDLPPGTGDVQLTISQQVIIDGAIIVSTPQDISLLDAVRGIRMFEKVDVPVLGMIQNMSFYCCPNCNHMVNIFGKDGASKKAQELGIQLLANIPLDPDVCTMSDQGTPIVLSKPESIHAAIYTELAKKIANSMNL